MVTFKVKLIFFMLGALVASQFCLLLLTFSLDISLSLGLAVVEIAGLLLLAGLLFSGDNRRTNRATVARQDEPAQEPAGEPNPNTVQLLSQTLYKAAHEIRNPLLAIQTSSELIKEYGSRISEEKKQIYLLRIQTSVKNIEDTINDVLAVSRLQAEKAQINLEPVDLGGFCQDIIAEMQFGREARTIDFLAQGQARLVYADTHLLRPVLTNLLSNALKYSPQGGPVNFRLEYHDRGVRLQIQDRGIGIPACDQARLFEVFFRASNTGAIQGSGLGLSIVKKNVELHGGLVTFQSSEGQGTTFVVDLPLRYGPPLGIKEPRSLTSLPPVA